MLIIEYGTTLLFKVGQTNLVFGNSSLVDFCMQDYKALRVAVTICITMVNILTDTQTDSILTSLYE